MARCRKMQDEIRGIIDNEWAKGKKPKDIHKALMVIADEFAIEVGVPNVAMKDATLGRAAGQFQMYGEHHRAKGPEGEIKAQVNYRFHDECVRALGLMPIVEEPKEIV